MPTEHEVAGSSPAGPTIYLSRSPSGPHQILGVVAQMEERVNVSAILVAGPDFFLRFQVGASGLWQETTQ